MSILVSITEWDPDEWAGHLRNAMPGRTIRLHPDVGDPEAVQYGCAWRAPAGVFSGLPNLRAIFSLGAGVDHIFNDPELPDVPVVRIVDPDLTMRMSEWVTLQVLLHHRRQLDYDSQQRERLWRPRRQHPASAVRVGIMGLGVLGRDAASILARLGFQVAGWSAQPKALPDIDCYYGPDGLPGFLARTDILVVLLPLTPETEGIIDGTILGGLARDGVLPGPVLINAGRGGLQNEPDIVEALRNGTLSTATLDVFETEPLPQSSPLWDLPNVVITPHVAASSDAEVLTRTIAAQVARHEAGQDLQNIVDPARRY